MTNDHAEHAETFRRMCEEHDLTFAFSDDHRHYVNGLASFEAIKLYADAWLDPTEAADIWNFVVDTKLIPEHRATYYWKANPKGAA